MINAEKTFLENFIRAHSEEFSKTFSEGENLIVTSTEKSIYVSPGATEVLESRANDLNGPIEDAFDKDGWETKLSIAKMFKETFTNTSQNSSWMKTFVAVAPYFEQTLSITTANDVLDGIFENRQKYLKEHENALGVKREFNSWGQKPISVVALRLDSLNQKYLSPKEVLMEEFETLYHEFGHIILGYGENTAETFSILSNAKLFGTNLARLEERINEDSAEVLFNKDLYATEYYFSKEFYGLKSLLQKINVDELDMKDMAYYADKICLWFNNDEETLEKIHKTYKNSRKLRDSFETPYKRKNKEKILRSIVSVMLNNKDDYDIYTAGKQYISQAWEQDIIKEQLKLNSVFWNKAVSKMEKHEKETGFTPDFNEILDRRWSITTLIIENRLNNKLYEEVSKGNFDDDIRKKRDYKSTIINYIIDSKPPKP